jgi:hypothetical protein
VTVGLSASINVYGFSGSSGIGTSAVVDNMERLAEKLKQDQNKPVFIQPKGKGEKKTYNVLIGLFEDQGKAFGYLNQIMSTYPGSFIVELK